MFMVVPQTIFEINKTSKTQAFSVMKQKRSRHSEAIQSTLIRRQKRKADASCHADDNEARSDVQMSTDADVQVSAISEGDIRISQFIAKWLQITI